MPINYSRRLTGKARTASANRHLGVALAFVAGAINAGGFLAVGQYTSHLTGTVSSMADHLALGTFVLALAGLGAVLPFVLGAACCAFLVSYSRQKAMHSQFALPLMLEAGLLLCFGLLGARLSGIEGLFVSMTVMLLSFIMGLQNALITKLSHAVIRTTHITGIVTDIGIELGKLAYGKTLAPEGARRRRPDWPRLTVLSQLLVCFFVGGIVGAFGFKHLGYAATIPLALVLLALASVPIIDDLVVYFDSTR